MKRYLVSIFLALAAFTSPAAALVCNDPSGFIKLVGPATLGDVLILWPDCQSASDGGTFPPGIVVGSTTVSGGTTLGFLYNNAGVLGNSTFVKQATNGFGTPSLVVGQNGSTGDDSAIIVTRTLTPASGNLNSHAVRDETNATSNVNGGFSGYASFDCAPNILGSNITLMNHVHCFQARAVYSNIGAVTEWAGYTVQAAITTATNIAAVYGVKMSDASKAGGGTISNQYAVYSDPLSAGAANYFLYGSGTRATGNKSVLMGGLFVGRASAVSSEMMNVEYDGSFQQGFLFNDVYALAAGLAAFTFVRAGSQVGSVTTTLAGTQYNTTSDERLKNFTGRYSARDAEKIIRADPVKTFDWKFDGSSAIGWGAQTSYAISHDLATPGTNPDDAWGMDYAKRTPYLWAATSRLLDRVDALENKVWLLFFLNGFTIVIFVSFAARQHSRLRKCEHS